MEFSNFFQIFEFLESSNYRICEFCNSRAWKWILEFSIQINSGNHEFSKFRILEKLYSRKLEFFDSPIFKLSTLWILNITFKLSHFLYYKFFKFSFFNLGILQFFFQFSNFWNPQIIELSHSLIFEHQAQTFYFRNNAFFNFPITSFPKLQMFKFLDLAKTLFSHVGILQFSNFSIFNHMYFKIFELPFFRN